MFGTGSVGELQHVAVTLEAELPLGAAAWGRGIALLTQFVSCFSGASVDFVELRAPCPEG